LSLFMVAGMLVILLLPYLLRLRLTTDEKGSVWRVSLENPHTGARLTFATLERLIAFLEDQCVQYSDHFERSSV
jgi:hypothetical protein